MAYSPVKSDIDYLLQLEAVLPIHAYGLRKVAVCDWGRRDVGYFHGFFPGVSYEGKPIVTAMVEYPDGTTEAEDVTDQKLLFLDILRDVHLAGVKP